MFVLGRVYMIDLLHETPENTTKTSAPTKVNPCGLSYGLFQESKWQDHPLQQQASPGLICLVTSASDGKSCCSCMQSLFEELLFPPSAKVKAQRTQTDSEAAVFQSKKLEFNHHILPLAFALNWSLESIPSHPVSQMLFLQHFSSYFHPLPLWRNLLHLWPHRSSLKYLQSSEGISIGPCGPAPASIGSRNVCSQCAISFERFWSFVIFVLIAGGFPYDATHLRCTGMQM